MRALLDVCDDLNEKEIQKKRGYMCVCVCVCIYIYVYVYVYS